jgi:hypothetical protein
VANVKKKYKQADENHYGRNVMRSRKAAVTITEFLSFRFHTKHHRL